jgi:hypothetical protein
MKKQLVLISCILTLLLSGMAQSQMQKLPEQFLKENNFHEENKFVPQKPHSQAKNAVWFEPDTIYTFDIDGSFLNRYISLFENKNHTIYLTQRWWLSSGQWRDEEKYTYTYDSHNNMTEELHEKWSVVFGNLMSRDRYTYTYDIHNNMTEKLYQYWNSGQWENRSKYTYTYDSQNNVIEELRQSHSSGQ